jgi:epidermal growth factor receptor substrate 15
VADLYYIEEDYYNPSLGYFVYTADAAAAIASSATMSVSGDKVVEAAATMSATFTQSASITHIEGVDLFAFTNAALAAQASRIRDSNISVSAVFSAAIDVSRIVQVNADESAEFTFTTTVVRSRDAELALLAAFSLTGDSTRIQSAVASLAVSSSLSATISHIEGADLTAFVNASLSASAISTRDAVASVASQFTLTASLGGTINAGAAFTANATLSATARLLEPRTTFTTDFGDGFTTLSITNSSPKFGAGALNIPVITDSSGNYNEYSGVQFITVSTQVYYFSNGYTYISSDLTGTSWTRYSNNLTAIGRNVIRVGSNFITYSGSANGNTFYSSSDGLTWTSTAATSELNSGQTFSGLPIVYFVNSNYYVLATTTSGTRVYRGTALTNLSQIFQDTSPTTTVQVSDFVLSGSQLSYYGYRTSGASTFSHAYFSNNGGGWTGFGTGSPTNYFAQEYNVVDGVYYVYRTNSAQTAHVISYASSTSGPWTNLTVSGEVYTIRGGNGKVFVRYVDQSLYSGSSITSLSEITNYAKGALAATNTFWTGSRFINFADNKVYTSTDGTTFSSNLLPVPANSLPGKITYTSLTNDFNSLATIDFWIKISSSNFNTFLKIQGDDFNKLLFISQSNSSLLISGGFNDNSGVNLLPASNAFSGGWNHVRIAFSSGVARIWINGATAATDSSWGGTFGLTNAKVIISGSGSSNESDLQIDELLITDELLTSPSTSSFSVPTSRWNNSDSTDLLLHFNSDFYDDSELFVNPSASLTATATLSAALTGTKTFASTLSSQFAVNAVIGKLNEIVLTAFNNASLTATITKFIQGESSQSAAFAISVDNARTRDSASNQSSEFAQALTFDRFRSGSSTIASEFAQSTTAVKTTSVVSTASSEFTQSTAVIKTAEATLSISSAFTPVINVLATKNGEIILQTAVTLSAVNERTRGLTASITSTATLTAVATRTRPASASLVSEFAVDASPTGTIFAAASFTSQFTQTTAVQRNRFGEAAFSSVFQQNTNTIDSLARQGSAALSASSALSAVNVRVRFASIATDSIFSELVVTAVSASATIAMSTTASMSITATRTRGIDSAISANAALSVPGERIKASAQASLAVLAALNAEGTTNITGEADLTVNTTLTAMGQRGRDILLVAFGNAALTATAARTRDTGSTITATATMTVAITKLITTSATLVSTASFTAAGTRQRDATANLIANGGVLVVGKVIKIDTYVYEIPAETRIHIINSETRKYTIRSETRKYTIRRA